MEAEGKTAGLHTPFLGQHWRLEGSLEAEGNTAGHHTPVLGQHWRQARRVEPGLSSGAPTPLPTFRVGLL